jgi:hypothetical protein
MLPLRPFGSTTLLLRSTKLSPIGNPLNFAEKSSPRSSSPRAVIFRVFRCAIPKQGYPVGDLSRSIANAPSK